MKKLPKTEAKYSQDLPPFNHYMHIFRIYFIKKILKNFVENPLRIHFSKAKNHSSYFKSMLFETDIFLKKNKDLLGSTKDISHLYYYHNPSVHNFMVIQQFYFFLKCMKKMRTVDFL